jgi:hypothetical protein
VPKKKTKLKGVRKFKNLLSKLAKVPKAEVQRIIDEEKAAKKE